MVLTKEPTSRSVVENNQDSVIENELDGNFRPSKLIFLQTLKPSRTRFLSCAHHRNAWKAITRKRKLETQFSSSQWGNSKQKHKRTEWNPMDISAKTDQKTQSPRRSVGQENSNWPLINTVGCYMVAMDRVTVLERQERHSSWYNIDSCCNHFVFILNWIS